METQGHRAVPGFRRPTYGQHGIDGLFFNANPPPTYIVMEAKYHKSGYGNTKDGKQMSDSWIFKKLRVQVSRELFDDIVINEFEKAVAKIRSSSSDILIQRILSAMYLNNID